jgi:hypothetical protein
MEVHSTFKSGKHSAFHWAVKAHCQGHGIEKDKKIAEILVFIIILPFLSILFVFFWTGV